MCESSEDNLRWIEYMIRIDLLGLDYLIWREIRSKHKAKSIIGLDESLGFQSNLMKIRSQHLFTMEIAL